MTDELAAAVDVPRTRRRTRVRVGLRTPANWLELVRFALVGASGYVVNLLVFTFAVHGLDADYRIAAVAAFLVALTNNFFWNRRWTFRGHTARAHFQAARFFVVSLVAFALNLLLLELLVRSGVPEVPAQALAIAAATPVSFLGNKLWSFGS